MELKWHAIYTKPRFEKKVIESLTKKKIENYCPFYTTCSKWYWFKKSFREPLLSSYIFVRVNERQYKELLCIKGVINLAYWLNKPAIIPDKEIKIIKEFLKEYKNVRLKKTPVTINDTIRVRDYTLVTHKSEVWMIKNNIIQVALPSLGYLISGEILQKSDLEVISQKSEPSHTSSEYKYTI
jgi:transcription antitermination factor NusG